MAETYCGKSCGDCLHKEKLNCSGCKTGPGRLGGECALARCIRERNLKSCESCSLAEHCGIRKSRVTQPEYFLKMSLAEKADTAAMAVRAKGLAKWFLLRIVILVLNITGLILATDLFSRSAYPLYLVGSILSFLCPAAHAVMLFQLANTESAYRRAGILLLCAFALAGVGRITVKYDTVAFWFYLFAFVVVLVTRFFECKGHAAVLVGADHKVSDLWELLGKGFLAVPLVGVILGTVFLVLGCVTLMLLDLACLVMTFIVFRRYSNLREGAEA